MSPTRRLARPMLAAIFITSGVSQLKNHEYVTEAARGAGLSEPELIAKAHVYGSLVGGLALATGRFTRLASLSLAANLIPTTIVGHNFWSAPEDQKMMQQINFMKNLSILGGLLLAAADTGGRESIPHAVGRVSRRAAKKSSKAAGKASKKAGQASKKAQSRLPIG